MSRLRRDISPVEDPVRRSGLRARRPRGRDRRPAVRGAARCGRPPTRTTTPPRRDACCVSGVARARPSVRRHRRHRARARRERSPRTSGTVGAATAARDRAALRRARRRGVRRARGARRHRTGRRALVGAAHDGPVPPGPPGRRAAHVPDRREPCSVEELGLEPGPELRELEQRILAQDPTLRPVRAVSTETARQHDHRRIGRIPNRLTSIIGRDDVLTDLGDELTRARLVTLLGPGGAGKTTIATELARRASTRSVTFVEFAPLTDPDSVIPAIASELGISAGDTPAAAVGLSTLDRVIDAIAGSPHLLVLDNCEHVVDAAAKAVYELLEACPDLVVLATSREALGVPGEAVRPLPPLAADAAARLFVERALRRRARPRRRRSRRSGRRRDLRAGRRAPAGDRVGGGTHPVDARDRVAGAARRPVHRARVRSAHGRSPPADTAGRRRLEPRPPRRTRTRRVPTPDRVRRRSHARRRRGRVQRRRRRAARRGRRDRRASHRQVVGDGRPLVGTGPLLDVGDARRVRGRAPPRVGRDRARERCPRPLHRRSARAGAPWSPRTRAANVDRHDHVRTREPARRPRGRGRTRRGEPRAASRRTCRLVLLHGRPGRSRIGGARGRAELSGTGRTGVAGDRARPLRLVDRQRTEHGDRPRRDRRGVRARRRDIRSMDRDVRHHHPDHVVVLQRSEGSAGGAPAGRRGRQPPVRRRLVGGDRGARPRRGRPVRRRSRAHRAVTVGGGPALRGGRRRVLAGDRPDRGVRDRRDVRRLRRGARHAGPRDRAERASGFLRQAARDAGAPGERRDAPGQRRARRADAPRPAEGDRRRSDPVAAHDVVHRAGDDRSTDATAGTGVELDRTSVGHLAQPGTRR